MRVAEGEGSRAGEGGVCEGRRDEGWGGRCKVASVADAHLDRVVLLEEGGEVLRRRGGRRGRV